MIPVTTVLLNKFKEEREILTGKERHDIVGDAVSKEIVDAILTDYKGLEVYWQCIPKAERALEIINRGELVFGSLMITSGDYKSEYGYYFNPPYELHSWIELEGGIIFDGALPGVIMKGLITCDHIGPSLVDRKPVILAGKPLDWMRYQVYERKHPVYTRR